MLTRQEIDTVSPDHPVFIPRGGHVVTVNSKALELAGVTKDTPNPDGGVIVRDERTGEATGVLLQNAANLVRRILPPPPPPPAAAELLKGAMRELNGFGIVGVVEPGVDERVMALYRASARRRRDDGAHRRALPRADQGAVREGHRGRPRRRRTATCCASPASRCRSTAASRAVACRGPTASCRASSSIPPIAACCCCRPAARTSMSKASSSRRLPGCRCRRTRSATRPST